tara:strand:- start:1072 stop:1542 length:471 start_codon:yes stop_codon:yes gene_type:complete
LAEDTPFWKSRSLQELSHDEWESLCDGCGKCCLLKLEEEDTGEIAYTRLHCRLFNPDTCRCSNYDDRKQYVPDCVQLTPDNIPMLKWMPRTCAYRLIAEGRDLPDWHHLVSGDRAAIHKAGKSVLGKTLSEDSVLEEDQVDWIIDWESAGMGEEDF